MLAAAPPHAGQGRQGHGAVWLGQGNRLPELLFSASGANWCSWGCAEVGDGTARVPATLDRERGDGTVGMVLPGPLGVNHAGLRRVRGGARRAEHSREIRFPNGRACS